MKFKIPGPILLSTIILVSCNNQNQETEMKPPIAQVKPHEMTIHGHTRTR